jgi:hypothetical protein
MRLTLDRVLTDPEALDAELRDRLGLDPLSIAVEDVDLVRETTRVSVRCTVADSWWLWADADADAAAASRRADILESGSADVR